MEPANERLIKACKTIAHDMAVIGLEQQGNEIFIGMGIALGRLYEAITGNDMRQLGPHRILKWAMDLSERDESVIHTTTKDKVN